MIKTFTSSSVPVLHRCGVLVCCALTYVIPCFADDRECERRDELDCGEECRELFGEDFKNCNRECLEKRCTIPKPKKSGIDAEDEQAAGAVCLESESAACDLECESSVSSVERTRCRRSCLQRACPEARKYDAAREGVDQGSVKCERCQSSAESDCKQQCKAGVITEKYGQQMLGRYGCQKLCVMTMCSSSCGGRLPF